MLRFPRGDAIASPGDHHQPREGKEAEPPSCHDGENRCESGRGGHTKKEGDFVNTFLPYSDFNKSAQCLDRQRLGKQRVEAYQILRVLTGEQKSSGWKNHPAVLMWKGYEASLARYATCMCLEWQKRGYLDTVLLKICNEFPKLIKEAFDNPPWLGDERFHSSHKSNLLRKNYSWYKHFEWNIAPDLEYVWPVKKSHIFVA